MEFVKLLNISLIIIAPFLIFLSAIHLASFGSSFYKEEFSKYSIEENVPEALELHQNVVDFLKGKSDYLPDRFNDREKQHLQDVRRLVLLSKGILYFLIGLSAVLIAALMRLKKQGKDLKQLIGKVLLFGGLLTIGLSALLGLLISSNFSYSFESFHKIFFQPGTYAFDPEYEIIVNLYPEGLFMDLGLRVAKFATITSFIFIAAGTVLLSKTAKINYRL